MRTLPRQCRAYQNVTGICSLAGFVFGLGMLTSPVGAQITPPGQVPVPPPQPGQVAPPDSRTTITTDQTAKGPISDVPVNAPSGVEDVDPELLIRTNVRSVLVPTTVIDRDTKGYVNGLTQKDFKLYDNDQLQKINAEFVELPLSLVFVVQANSEAESMLPRIKKSGVLVQGLVTGDNGDVAVLAFDHRQRVIQDFTTDPARLDDAMQKITTGSGTAALVDAVWQADRMLLQHDPKNVRRRVILLMSRDVDKGSQLKLQETARKMQFDNVLVYCVNMSKWLTTLQKKPDYPRPANGGIPAEATPNLRGNVNNDTTVIQQQNGNVLDVAPSVYRGIRDVFKKTPAEALTTFTGGKIYSFASNKALEQAISDIGRELQSQYVLSYSPTNKTEAGFHNIRVDINAPHLDIRNRPGYWWGGGAGAQ